MYDEVRVFRREQAGQALAGWPSLLGGAGIDILALDVADEGQFGVFKILTADPERRRAGPGSEAGMTRVQQGRVHRDRRTGRAGW